jgi:hypothetical protein
VALGRENVEVVAIAKATAQSVILTFIRRCWLRMWWWWWWCCVENVVVKVMVDVVTGDGG